MDQSNKIGLKGLGFCEFSSAVSSNLEELFWQFGFSLLKKHLAKNITYYKQNNIHFFINHEKNSHALSFASSHGPCISAMGWLFENPTEAYQLALKRGAQPARGDYYYKEGKEVPAIFGIGSSLIYFISSTDLKSEFTDFGFSEFKEARQQKDKGFLSIDHLTNNVYNGTMQKWSEFYKKIFEFTEVRYFDIRGAQTGLTSYALRSPDGSFCIPINEAKERKSQINEYLDEYHGPGVQHLAFSTDDILMSLDALSGSDIKTLDIDDEYYQEIFNKFPQVSEDHQKIRNHQVLVDGDEKGYLLQIFTKNIIGPIFIEIIQRKNHNSFGEGNFGALFRSIERDQIKRGYI